MGCVTSGHVPRGHWAKSKDVPSWGMYYYYTVDYHRVSSVGCVVFAVSFLSALTFTGLEKYLILILVNYL